MGHLPTRPYKTLHFPVLNFHVCFPLQVVGEVAGEPLHALFATLVPGFPSPYQGLGLTALAAMTPDTSASPTDGPVNPVRNFLKI